MEGEDKPKISPPPPPFPPILLAPRSTTFDGTVRLNDLLMRDLEEEIKTETASVVSSASGESAAGAIPIAETACEYFDEEQDVLKTPQVKFRGRSPLTKSQSSDAHLSDRDSASVGSAESGHVSKLQTIIHKAKVKGKNLVHRRKSKSKKHDDPDMDDEMVQVNMEMENKLNAMTRLNDLTGPDRPLISPAVIQTMPPAPALKERDDYRKIPFFKFRLTVAALMVVGTVFLPYFLSGFLWGIYLCTVAFLYAFVSKPIHLPHGRITQQDQQKISDEIERQKELQESVVYKGWMNELRGRYDPTTYSVNKTHSVLVRLDGKFLRISRPDRSIYKHSYQNDPSLTEPEPTMVAQSLYDLTDAKVTLRPKSLAPRRWWVRKYPIHIRLASMESVVTEVDAKSRNRRISKSSASVPEEDSESSAYETESSDEEMPQSVKTHKKTNSRSENDLTQISTSADVTLPPKKKRVPQGKSIYLFVRAHREKERWFHRLREACSQYRTLPPKTAVVVAEDGIVRRQSAQSLPEAATLLDANKLCMNSEYFLYISNSIQFSRYMAEVLRTTPDMECIPPETGVVHMDLGRSKWIPGLANPMSDVVAAANALASRIFYDFCRDEYWVSKVRDKIQNKLSTIHLPYFIETLELSKFELGSVAPAIIGVYPPILNDWGLWTDLEIVYPGGLQLVLETKVNLMRLKTLDEDGDVKRKPSRAEHTHQPHHYSDTERPISPESSADEDYGAANTDQNPTGKGKKLLTFVDKLANSSFFQGATDLKPVKKMMEGISSTRLLLNVEVTGLEGTMAINFAPPPSDRFWYGFRRSPKLTLKAVPQVGDRAVEFSAISDWIENRLRILLEKNLVMPNMDDIIIPVMSGNEMLNFGYNK